MDIGFIDENAYEGDLVWMDAYIYKDYAPYWHNEIFGVRFRP